MSLPNVIPSLAGLKDLLNTEVGVSDYITVDQQRINQFADITEDWQWIHVDVERAREESPARTTVAHGFLTLSLLSRFLNGWWNCEAPSRPFRRGSTRSASLRRW
jgi:acyl dehydratase